jgi:hypothetical protein
MNVCKMAIITNRSSIGEGNCGNWENGTERSNMEQKKQIYSNTLW